LPNPIIKGEEMLAIPVDIEMLGAKSSLLFGNASVFALYNTESKEFDFRKNPGCGNGIETANALKSWDVKKVVYSFLGDGPFNALVDDGVEVYYIGEEPMTLGKVVEGLNEKLFTKVDAINASEYLNPGTASGECQCGCSHD
jgi:predicted Fe-Mo cluster-binding NifX family protein